MLSSVWYFPENLYSSHLTLSRPGIVSNVTDTLLDSPVSGLLGLAFPGVSSSGSTPLWLALASTPGTLDAPLMAFHLTRFVNDSQARAVEIGGSFTLGAVNHTLYTGEIDYQDVPQGAAGYWTLPLSGVCTQSCVAACLGSSCVLTLA